MKDSKAIATRLESVMWWLIQLTEPRSPGLGDYGECLSIQSGVDAK